MDLVTDQDRQDVGWLTVSLVVFIIGSGFGALAGFVAGVILGTRL